MGKTKKVEGFYIYAGKGTILDRIDWAEKQGAKPWFEKKEDIQWRPKGRGLYRLYITDNKLWSVTLAR